MRGSCRFLVWGSVFCCLLLAGAIAWAGEIGVPGRRTVLLVDDHDVLYRPGTKRVVHSLRRHAGNPVVGETKPWEVAIAWCSIYRDPRTGRYQLWYQAYTGKVARTKTHTCVVCYAESEDGIHFTKPDLGLHSIAGHKRTNIVLVGRGGHSLRYCCSVVVDPRDSDPSRRYKMVYFDFGIDGGKEYPGLHVAFSPDGIHWTKHTKTPLLRSSYGTAGQAVPFGDEKGRPWSVPLSMSDAVDVFYDPKRGVFAGYGKMWIDGPDGGMYWKHAMGRTQSKDFTHWSKPTVILTPDEADKPWVEFHTAPVFYHNDCYFCLNQILDRGTGGGVIDIELAISRDGIDWDRPFRDRFVLARSKGNKFDGGSIFTNSTPVVLADEIRFYYGAYSQGATGGDDYSQASGVGLATLPRDRFAGLRPLAESDQPTLGRTVKNVGQVTLKPIDLAKYDLITVNADATSGSIRIELLDADARRLRGFAKGDAIPIRGDSLRHVASWKNRTLGDLAAGTHMLRLHLDNATAYAITLSKAKQP